MLVDQFCSHAMDEDRIEARLGGGAVLTAEESNYVREAAISEDSDLRRWALGLLRANAELCGITSRDSHWLASIADCTEDLHVAADALSVLCNWLANGGQNRDRIVRALRCDPGSPGGVWMLITGSSLAGNLLAQGTCPEVARALRQVLHSGLPTEIRESARDAFLRANGMTARDIVLAERSGSLDLWGEASRLADALAT